MAALDFFTPAVREAHAFLAPLWEGAAAGGAGGQGSCEAAVAASEEPAAALAAAEAAEAALGEPADGSGTAAVCTQPRGACSDPLAQLQHLQDSIAAGQLLHLQLVPGALQLCLPPVLAVLQGVLRRVPEQPSAAALQRGGDAGAAPAAVQQAVGVLLSLLGAAPRALCTRHLLPAVASMLGGGSVGADAGLPWDSKLALLSPQLVVALLAGGGVAAFMDTVQPVLLRQLLAAGVGGGAAGPAGIETAAVAALCSVARQVSGCF